MCSWEVPNTVCNQIQWAFEFIELEHDTDCFFDKIEIFGYQTEEASGDYFDQDSEWHS